MLFQIFQAFLGKKLSKSGLFLFLAAYYKKPIFLHRFFFWVRFVWIVSVAISCKNFCLPYDNSCAVKECVDEVYWTSSLIASSPLLSLRVQEGPQTSKGLKEATYHNAFCNDTTECLWDNFGCSGIVCVKPRINCIQRHWPGLTVDFFLKVFCEILVVVACFYPFVPSKHSHIRLFCHLYLYFDCCIHSKLWLYICVWLALFFPFFWLSFWFV